MDRMSQGSLFVSANSTVVFRWITMTKNTLCAAALLAVLAGCGMNQVSQGIYEGSQTRNQLLTPPGERIEKRDFSTYGAYDQQRSEILIRDNAGGTTSR